MLQAILTFMSAASAVLAVRGQQRLSDYVALAAVLMREGDAAHDELVALAAEIQAMVDADRDPTDDEWNTVRTRRAALSAKIQGAAGEEGAEGVDSDDPGPPSAA